MITASQIRAARSFLNMDQSVVANAAGVSKANISDIENEKVTPKSSTMQAIQKFFELSGIEFTSDGGIRPNKVFVRQYIGAEGFREFMDDVYEVAKTQGGEICLHNAKPDNWLKWLGVEWNTTHTNRMLSLGKLNFKITAGHNDYQMIGKHAEYRWLPEHMWNEQSFYAYGDRIALLNFEEDNVNIIVMYNRKFADGFRSLFNVTWEHAAIVPPQKET